VLKGGLSVEFKTHIDTRMVSLDLGGRTVMMGTKARRCAPLPKDISLEDLAPEDHFCRRLETRLDLSFVR
jgi:hypothetical protein